MFRNRDVIFDTNILVAVVVVAVDESLILRHKRVASMGLERRDIRLIHDMVGMVRNIMVTPHILAETSNLLRTPRDGSEILMMALRKLVDDVLDERFVAAVDVVAQPAFERVGFTDAGILALAASSTSFLSTDFELVNRLIALGVDAVNFTHLRELARR